MENLVEGQVILVYLRNAGPAQQAGIALENPEWEELFGDRFLTGRVPSSERDWASGLRASVRFAEIQHLLLFDSREEYEARIEAAPSAWELPEPSPDVS